MLHSILINTVLPIRFLYGEMRGIEKYKATAVEWLQQLKAEQNNIVQQWDDLGINSRHAADTQALLQLKHEYCDKKACLECNVGHYLLNR